MRLVAVTFLLLACTACDSDAPSPSPRAVVLDEDRPCDVATAAEVARATRGEAGVARPQEARGKDRTLLCHYPVGPPYSSVTLYAQTGVSEEEFRERMDRDPLNTDPLEGVGDLAFIHGGVGVSVWEDGDAISASVQKYSDPDGTRETVERLAALIESKL